MNPILAIVLIEVLCVMGVLADYYFKLAGAGRDFISWHPFLLGFVLYAVTTFGWFLVLKYIKLVQVGVLYSVSIVLLLTLLGVFRFHESLSGRELLGIILAVTSLMLMSRFA